LLADNHDVHDVIIVCRDYITYVFDGLPNNNTLCIPADGTADEKIKTFSFVVLKQYSSAYVFSCSCLGTKLAHL